MIYNSRDFSDFSDIPLLARVVDIFLTAAEHKGHAQFINTLTLTNHSCILSQAIEKNNLACAEVALKHNASLAIQCYSQKDRTHYYPLLYACKTFGADSPMVKNCYANIRPPCPQKIGLPKIILFWPLFPAKTLYFSYYIAFLRVILIPYN